MDQKTSAATEFRDFARTLPSTSAEWDPFSAYLVEHTPLYARAAFRDYALGVYMSRRHFIRRVIGGNAVEGWTDPGTINLIPPGIDASCLTATKPPPTGPMLVVAGGILFCNAPAVPIAGSSFDAKVTATAWSKKPKLRNRLHTRSYDQSRA